MFTDIRNLLILQVVTQELAYDKGGGYIRCLMLFTNMVPTSPDDKNSNTEYEYKKYVRTIGQTMPKSVMKTLHWDKDVHEMTRKLYGLSYKYDLSYKTVI